MQNVCSNACVRCKTTQLSASLSISAFCDILSNRKPLPTDTHCGLLLHYIHPRQPSKRLYCAPTMKPATQQNAPTTSIGRNSGTSIATTNSAAAINAILPIGFCLPKKNTYTYLVLFITVSHTLTHTASHSHLHTLAHTASHSSLHTLTHTSGRW